MLLLEASFATAKDALDNVLKAFGLRLVRPPLPPFNNIADAVKKVQMAEDGWNSRDPEKVSLAYTEDGALLCTFFLLAMITTV